MTARVVELSPRIARRLIACRWWTNLPVPPHQSANEADQPWNWEEEVRRIEGNSQIFGLAAITATPERTVEAQGAIICDLRGQSLREPGRPVLYLQWLASNPRNRVRLVGDRAIYRGVGEALVLIALLESYSVGYQGRVLLQSLPGTERFYERWKFRVALDPQGKRNYYEISGNDAQVRLKAEGWI